MEHKKIDCRWSKDGEPCTITVTGLEKDVFPVILHHVVKHHGHEETPELHETIKQAMTEKAPA